MNKQVAQSPYHYRLQPWVVCFTAALFFFYEFVQMTMFNSLNVQLRRDFNISAVQLSHLSAAYFYANVLFLFIAGTLLDRFSTKFLLCAGMLCCVISTYVFALSHHLLIAELSRFVTGIASTFTLLGCVRLASRWFPPQRMALVTGLIVTMAMLGGMVAQAPLTLLVASWGWRAAVLFNASCGLMFWLFMLLVIEDYPKDHVHTHRLEQRALDRLGFARTVGIAIANRQNWLAGIFTNFLSLPVIMLGALWGSRYLVAVKGLSTVQASMVSSMIFLGMIIGSPALGYLSDWWGRRKLPMLLSAIFSLVVALLIMFVPNLSYSALLILFLLLGFITGGQVISYALIAESNHRLVTATAESLACTIIMSAGAIFQPLFGWLMEVNNHSVIKGDYSAHAYQAAMWILPVTFVCCIVLVAGLKETYCKAKK